MWSKTHEFHKNFIWILRLNILWLLILSYQISHSWFLSFCFLVEQARPYDFCLLCFIFFKTWNLWICCTFREVCIFVCKICTNHSAVYGMRARLAPAFGVDYCSVFISVRKKVSKYKRNRVLSIRRCRVASWQRKKVIKQFFSTITD